MELKDLLIFFKRKALVVFICILIITGLIFVPIVLYFRENTTNISDFERYYNTARTILNGNIDQIYNYDVTNMSYRYFPSFAMLLIPFLSLTPQVAYIAYVIINIAVFIIGTKEMQKIGQLLGYKVDHVILFSLFFPCVADSIIMGQNVFLVTTMILISFRFFLERKVYYSGFFLGISFLLKPVTMFIMLLMFVTFMRKKEYKKMCKFFIVVFIPLIPDITIFLTKPDVLGAFINSSVLHSDFRTAGSSISFVSFFYYFFDIKFFYFLVPGLLFFLPYFYKKQGIGKPIKKEETSRIFITGTILHFVFFVDIWFSQLVIANFFISLLWCSKEDWKAPLKPIVIINFISFPLLHIPVFTPIACLIQLFMMFAWSLIIHKASNYKVQFKSEIRTNNSLLSENPTGTILGHTRSFSSFPIKMKDEKDVFHEI